MILVDDKYVYDITTSSYFICFGPAWKAQRLQVSIMALDNLQNGT